MRKKKEKKDEKAEKRGKRGKAEQMREVYLMHYNFMSASSPADQTKINNS